MNVDNPDEQMEPAPTHNEALQAVLTLGRYVKEVDDPFMRKLESMWGLFVGKKAQALKMKTLKDTKITDYYS